MFESEISKIRNSALHGMFHAPDIGITLRFQFNPDEIGITKGVNYGQIEAPQYPTQIITWEGNEQKLINFKLEFHTSDSDILNPSVIRRSLGTLGIEAILETLTLPSSKRPFQKVFEAGNFIKSTLASFSIPGGDGVSLGSLATSTVNAVSDLLSSVVSELTTSDQDKRSTTYAPPDVYLILGRRWFRGKLRGFDVTEKNFNRFLTPRWLTTDIGFLVIEDGQFAEQQDNQRIRWAKIESSISNLENQANIIEAAAGYAFDAASSNLNISSSSLLEMPMDLGL